MRVLMRVPAEAILEFRAPAGLLGLTYTEGDQRQRATWIVYPSANDTEDFIEGSYDHVLSAVQGRIDARLLNDLFLTSFLRTTEGMMTQAFPTLELGPTELIQEQRRVRHARREWLLEQIESGSYAAIERLKEEYGDEVKIKVEVIES